MERLVREALNELVAHESSTCISIYIPTHAKGVEVNEMHDAIKLKEKLQTATKRLISEGWTEQDASRLVKQGLELTEDREFWNRQQNGLAVFLAEGYFRFVQMPISPGEELFINSSFYIVPLLSMQGREQNFYLLVLSKQNASFYRGDAYNIEELEVEGLPYGMDDVIHFEEKSGKQLMRRAGAGAGRGAASGASFHGHGAGLAADTEYLANYCREVDQTLWSEVLSTQHSPLVLAGVDYVVAHFKQISRYKYIAEDSLNGNYDREHARELHRMAVGKLAGYFDEPVKKALKNYYDNSGAGGLSTFIPQDVIPASYYSKISDLFIEENQHIWGTFDEITNDLKINEEKQAKDTCLINRAAVKTILNGGDVHVLPKDRMPADTKVAAFMRY